MVESLVEYSALEEAVTERKIGKTVSRRFLEKSTGLEEITISIKNARDKPILQIGLTYQPEDVDDTTDTTYGQRQKPQETEHQEQLYLSLPNQQNITIDVSYVGSGVIKAAYHTVLDEFRAAESAWNDEPTPEQAGKVIQRIVAEAVVNAGDHIDPEAKERMVYWLKTPQGQVWRDFYQAIAVIKTQNWNLTHVS
jgi:hypothetical protein